MKKIALASLLAMFAGSSAFAGNVAPVVSDEPMMVEEDTKRRARLNQTLFAR